MPPNNKESEVVKIYRLPFIICKKGRVFITLPLISRVEAKPGHRDYSLSTFNEVQMMTDPARRESVKRYAVVQLDAKRRLLEGKQQVL